MKHIHNNLFELSKKELYALYKSKVDQLSNMPLYYFEDDFINVYDFALLEEIKMLLSYINEENKQ